MISCCISESQMDHYNAQTFFLAIYQDCDPSLKRMLSYFVIDYRIEKRN